MEVLAAAVAAGPLKKKEEPTKGLFPNTKNKTKKKGYKNEVSFLSAPEEARTPAVMIKSHVPYQLGDERKINGVCSLLNERTFLKTCYRVTISP